MPEITIDTYLELEYPGEEVLEGEDKRIAEERKLVAAKVTWLLEAEGFREGNYAARKMSDVRKEWEAIMIIRLNDRLGNSQIDESLVNGKGRTKIMVELRNQVVEILGPIQAVKLLPQFILAA
jgi:hypothetical protein